MNFDDNLLQNGNCNYVIASEVGPKGHKLTRMYMKNSISGEVDPTRTNSRLHETLNIWRGRLYVSQLTHTCHLLKNCSFERVKTLRDAGDRFYINRKNIFGRCSYDLFHFFFIVPSESII